MALPADKRLWNILTDSFQLPFVTVRLAAQRDAQGNAFAVRLQYGTATLNPNPRLADFVIAGTGQRSTPNIYCAGYATLSEHLDGVSQLQLP